MKRETVWLFQRATYDLKILMAGDELMVSLISDGLFKAEQVLLKTLLITDA